MAAVGVLLEDTSAADRTSEEEVEVDDEYLCSSSWLLNPLSSVTPTKEGGGEKEGGRKKETGGGKESRGCGAGGELGTLPLEMNKGGQDAWDLKRSKTAIGTG